MRLLVIGADAAGMAAAHQALRTARRTGRAVEVVALEMTGDTSYSQCGVPYWIAGDVDDESDLIARSASEHRARGIDLRLRQEVTGLDLSARHAEVRDHDADRSYRLGFDEVLIATGGAPVLPDWACAPDGRPLPGVYPVKTLEDGRIWRELLRGRDGSRPRRAIVIGGGYIGVETAESLARLGIDTTLLTRREPMAASLVASQSAAVRAGLEALGVHVVGDSAVVAVHRTATGLVVQSEHATGQPADVVALAMGVTPRVSLAVEVGLPVADDRYPFARGALLPDGRQRVGDGVWAAGDCCAVTDLMLGQPAYLPLGTHANKAGRVAGTNLGGADATFPGAVGTAITRAGEVEVARTGLLPAWASDLGLEVLEAELESSTAAGYMPQASPMRVWVMAQRDTGRLLGCQITGGPGAGKRIDVAALALLSGLAARDVAYADLAYAPPFSPTWDPVQIACRKLAEAT